MNFLYKLGVIGYGNMASAIIEGAIGSKTLDADNIAVFDKDRNKCEIASYLGVYVADNLTELAASSEILLFAVKPQAFNDVCSEIKDKIKGKKIISILAGTTISKYKDALGDVAVVRVMPNTPALVGESVSAITLDEKDEELLNFTKELFSSVGKVLLVPESQINGITAISGSGPAYVYEFMSALFNKAITLGFAPEQAKVLVYQTVKGAATIYEQSEEELPELCAKVCSKGGTTIEAVNVFRKDGLEIIVDKAVQACFNRAEELSK